MSNKYNIKIPRGLNLLAGTIVQPDTPSHEDLKNHIYGLCLDNDEPANHDVIRGLVDAYSAMLCQHVEEEDLTEVEFATNGEDVYREYAIRGWREAVSRDYPDAAKSRDDEFVYESCDWYEFGRIHWPAQLIAEVGYLVGYKSGREAVAMSRYHEEHGHAYEGRG